MAMEISNSYGNYDTGMALNAKKKSGRAAENVKDDVQEYYENLCKKFSQITIHTNGDIVSSSKNKIVLNLSSECLKRMAGDPDYAKKIEKDIAGIPEAHERMFAKAKRDGIEIQGFAVRINADGSMQCSCTSSTRTSGAEQNPTMRNTEKRQKDIKRRAEKKLSEAVKTEKSGTKELSEAEEMALFKKEFYAELERIPRNGTIINLAINISEKAFENMKADPEYRAKIMSVLRRDITSSFAPLKASMLLTVGETEKDYRGDSWSGPNNDSEFHMRSQNSFYKKTSDKKNRQKKLQQEYLEKRAQAKKQQQEMLNEKAAKQQRERSRLYHSWNNAKLLAKASNAYETNVMTKTAADRVSVSG